MTANIAAMPRSWLVEDPSLVLLLPVLEPLELSELPVSALPALLSDLVFAVSDAGAWVSLTDVPSLLVLGLAPASPLASGVPLAESLPKPC